jgi:lipoprotein-releasing system permease protein
MQASFGLIIPVAGILALGTAAVLIVGFRFERFVGVRYLLRRQASRTVRRSLWATSLVAVIGAVLFVFARDLAHVLGQDSARAWETAGVLIALAGVLATTVFALLRLFSVFTTVATMGVVLGVASLIVVLAVTSGFEREFQDKVLAVNAHLIVTDYGIEHNLDDAERKADSFMRKLRGLPGLDRMSKFSFTAGEVMLGAVGANIKGIDLQGGAHELRRATVLGSVDDLGRPASCPGADVAGRIFLGTEVRHKLRAEVGGCVQVLVPITGTQLDAPPRALAFKVVGVFEMGFHEYDARLAFIPLEDTRLLGNIRQSVFGVELRFSDPLLAIRMQPEVERRLGQTLRVIDWKTLNHNLFMALTMQKLIIALVLGFITVVAAFNIVASLMLIVLGKVREIAILASMGASPASLRRIFVVAGSFIGAVGTSFGILCGLTVCALAYSYGYPLDPKVYLIAKLPVQISARELLLVATATQLICFAAALYPAMRASRLRVVEGLTYT